MPKLVNGNKPNKLLKKLRTKRKKKAKRPLGLQGRQNKDENNHGSKTKKNHGRAVTLHLPCNSRRPQVFIKYPKDVRCQPRPLQYCNRNNRSEEVEHEEVCDVNEDKKCLENNRLQNPHQNSDCSVGGCDEDIEVSPVSQNEANISCGLEGPPSFMSESQRKCPVKVDGSTLTKTPEVWIQNNVNVGIFSGWKHSCIVKVCEASGINLVDVNNNWSIFFGSTDKRAAASGDGSKISVSNDPDFFRQMQPWQKVSHFPGTWALGRKDRLAFSINAMRRTFPGTDFDFLPLSFVLPKDAYHLKRHLMVGQSKKFCHNLWIIKPVSDSCGRGISVISKQTLQKRWKNYSDPRRKKSILVQKYCAQPYLINGVKFDLRLYVLVTSINPLVIYLYDEGLVRLCTKKYTITKKNLKDSFVHLTNYSINKDSDNFQASSADGDEAVGHKWSFTALKNQWKASGVDVDGVMSAIRLLIAKTFVAVESDIWGRCYAMMGNRNRAFELFGFDLMFEKDLTPRLVEVNISPSLACETLLDYRIKSMLFADMLHLVGVNVSKKIPKFGKIPNKPGLSSQEDKNKSIAGLNQMPSNIVQEDSDCQNKHMNEGRVDARNISCSVKPSTPQAQSTSSDSGMLRHLHIPSEYASIVENFKAELSRKGNFSCIFPSRQPSTLPLLRFFKTKRPANVVLHHALGTQAGFSESDIACTTLTQEQGTGVTNERDSSVLPRRIYSAISPSLQPALRVRRPLTGHGTPIPASLISVKDSEVRNEEETECMGTNPKGTRGKNVSWDIQLRHLQKKLGSDQTLRPHEPRELKRPDFGGVASSTVSRRGRRSLSLQVSKPTHKAQRKLLALKARNAQRKQRYLQRLAMQSASRISLMAAKAQQLSI